MSSRWDTPNIPHKGWTCVDVFDVRAEGESVEETTYESCEMCGNERIRFVHLMRHQEHPTELRVGCVCAEKMSNDYVTPYKREQVLRSRADRRTKWLARKWRRSAKGNLWIKAGDFHVIVAAEIGQPGKFRGFINNKRGKFLYESEDTARLALFDAIEKMKEIAKKRAASSN
jgi:hypothetical protein